jgi:hypothetical protein
MIRSGGFKPPVRFMELLKRHSANFSDPMPGIGLERFHSESCRPADILSAEFQSDSMSPNRPILRF